MYKSIYMSIFNGLIIRVVELKVEGDGNSTYKVIHPDYPIILVPKRFIKKPKVYHHPKPMKEIRFFSMDPDEAKRRMDNYIEERIKYHQTQISILKNR